MSAPAFTFPHLDAIGALPPGLLYPHQADGVAFLISKGRAILADDMGLGKTRQAIVAMQVAAPEGAILVVCPASLKLNWRREIRHRRSRRRASRSSAQARPAGRRPNAALGHRELRPARASTPTGCTPSPGPASSSTRRTSSRTTRSAPRTCLKLLGVSDHARAAADRARPGLPADRHADDQPPARPLQPAALRRSPGGAQLHRPSPSATAPPTATTTAG